MLRKNDKVQNIINLSFLSNLQKRKYKRRRNLCALQIIKVKQNQQIYGGSKIMN